MGNTSSVLKLDTRKPRVVFGEGIDCAEEVAENLQMVKKILSGSETAITKISEKFPKLGLQGLISCAGIGSTLVAALLLLVESSDKLSKELGKLEQKILTLLLSGELKALKNCCMNLLDPNTNDVHKVSEIVSAVHSLHRILPLFTDPTSALNKRIDLSPPLLMQFCAKLQIIGSISKSTPGYNDTTVNDLVDEYKSALESFKIRWIRERILYTWGINGLQYKELPTRFPKYFKGRSYWFDVSFDVNRLFISSPSEEQIPRPSILKNPGPTTIQTATSSIRQSNFVHDVWDCGVQSERIVVTVRKEEFLTEWSNLSDDLNRHILFREALYQYRKGLAQAMEEYFDSCEL